MQIPQPMLQSPRYGWSRTSHQSEVFMMKGETGDPSPGSKEDQSLGRKWVKIASVVTLYWWVCVLHISFVLEYISDVKLYSQRSQKYCIVVVR